MKLTKTGSQARRSESWSAERGEGAGGSRRGDGGRAGGGGFPVMGLGLAALVALATLSRELLIHCLGA